MNVLSLFDGISTGQFALKSAGIEVENYYASEVDKIAEQIAIKHFPLTKSIGDVNHVNAEDYRNIDLLIGGSPCQSFSISGKKAYFNDPRGQLLNKFIEFKNHIEPAYFLLENVAMPKHCTDYVSEALGVPYVEINSKYFSAQDRKRFYWTNIPILPYKESPTVVKDILEDNVIGYTSALTAPLTRLHTGKRKLGYFGRDSQATRVYDVNYKGVCLCGEAGGAGGKTGLYEVGNVIRKLTPKECERMQTLPDGYTEGFTDNQRYRALGNGWTANVVTHIFKGLPKS